MATTTARDLAIRKTHKLYIGGKFVRTESGRSYQTDAGVTNVPRGSRKDVRDAVKAARGAFPGWAALTAYNRGQIIYRVAEMLDARRSEFVSLLGGTAAARREVAESVDSLIWYAGWCDKLHAVAGTVNPVAGPYFTFTLPEPTGVVGVVASADSALLSLVRGVAAALCGGNTVVALVSEPSPLPGLTLAEILATSDVPGGVVNLVGGLRRELLPTLASHMDVNAIDISGCSVAERTEVEVAATDNLKRVVWGNGDKTLEAVTSLMEMKTVWHPVGR